VGHGCRRWPTLFAIIRRSVRATKPGIGISLIIGPRQAIPLAKTLLATLKEIQEWDETYCRARNAVMAVHTYKQACLRGTVIINNVASLNPFITRISSDIQYPESQRGTVILLSGKTCFLEGRKRGLYQSGKKMSSLGWER
jgi:hypothetical protein